MNETLERQVIQLIATDRTEIPISSMSGKLKRKKPKLAQAIVLPDTNRYNGERVYANLREEDLDKARGMKEAIALFEQEFPKYGTILRGMIEKKRKLREKHLYFGVKDGCRLTADDYIGVMENLGLSEAAAKALYPEIIEVSRDLSRQRGYPERSILIGNTRDEDE
jgi:hypothetical protein